MTKNEVKSLCEDDDKLQWWAMVLFAEIAELVNSQQPQDLAVLKVIKTKVEEFPTLVVHRQLEKVKEKYKAAEAEIM